MASKNYYLVLGLQPNAELAEIKKAYRRLAFRYHPDQNRGGVSGEERFQEIKEAYETLSDPVKRRHYDISIRSQQIYAPSYEFARTFKEYRRPQEPKSTELRENKTSIEAETRPKGSWWKIFIKPLILIIVAMALMKMVIAPPAWFQNLPGATKKEKPLIQNPKLE